MDSDGFIDFDELTTEKVRRIGRKLDAASRCGVGTLRHRLVAEKIDALFKRATKTLKNEPTVLDLTFSDPETKLTVVGDTHGQLHDVLRMFEVTGIPGEHSVFVLNGDFVDRGSWGLETLILFLCWKLVFPKHVFLTRGNHESQLLTEIYGYKGELEAKYSRAQNRMIYSASKKLFASMPLAVVVQGTTLICHGGLFRASQRRVKRRVKKAKAELQLGTLAMLRKSSKGGVEPTASKVAALVSDILWSDPVPENGLTENTARGLGLIFGPDITDAFLETNDLKLIVRSHEGPDARFNREGAANMMTGFCVDHDVPHGKLVTVFSAPDYPQFQEGPERTCNAAAVVVLTAPDYATPCPVHFDAVHPRPSAPIFYDIEMHADTDIEFNELLDSSSALSHPVEESDLSECEPRGLVQSQIELKLDSSEMSLLGNDSM